MPKRHDEAPSKGYPRRRYIEQQCKKLVGGGSKPVHVKHTGQGVLVPNYAVTPYKLKCRNVNPNEHPPQGCSKGQLIVYVGTSRNLDKAIERGAIRVVEQRPEEWSACKTRDTKHDRMRDSRVALRANVRPSDPLNFNRGLRALRESFPT